MNKNLIILAVIALASTYLFVDTLRQKPAALQALEPEVYEAFDSWKSKYGKKYDDPDTNWYRITVFRTNYFTVKAVNDANLSYTFDQNMFMDMTPEEFKATYLQLQTSAATNTEYRMGGESLKTTVDWVADGGVSPVKDQGQCGSCWAFSTIGAIESVIRVANKTETRLFSEQDLVDCSKSYGNNGCGGGWMDNGFKYVIEKGIASGEDYKYTAVDGACKDVTRTKVISSFVDVPQGDVNQLKLALQTQPISIAVDASKWSFYKGGIFNDCGLGLDHGVLLVGYDEQGNWKVKNSWNTGWGEQGFIRLAPGNTCGLAQAASFPKI